jgi:hypothetical protein
MKLPTRLNGIEYLLLVIQSAPGESQRYYLRRLHIYQYGRPDFHKGGTNSGYFISPSYRNVTWNDHAPKEVTYPCWCPVDDRLHIPGGGWLGGIRSKCAQMHLTRSGWERANKSRQKIGLDPIPFTTVKEIR